MRGPSRVVRVLILAALLGAILPASSVALSANPPGPGDVLINEYVPKAGTEWVELYNTTGVDLDLSGHYIDDIASGGGAPKLIPNGTIIPAGGYYVMTFSNFLNNNGDDVRFLDPAQSALDSHTYSSSANNHSWYRSPDGGAWSPTQTDSPTQGSANPGGGPPPPGPGDVVINEYTANSSVTEWVELYNTTGSDLTIGGHFIDDIAGGGGAPQQIPGGTVITAGGFYTMDLSSFLNNGGDDVRFLDPAQTTVLDSHTYSFATLEYSWYRTTDGGSWSAEETDSPTKGSSNTPAPALGEVLINEFVANSATEWVELYNTTLRDLDISGHYIDDIAGGGGAPKLIPNGTIIPAGGFYVMTFSSFLNNGGDDVRFLDPAQSTVLDNYTYASANAEFSWYRFPDGGPWATVESDTPTQGASNPGTGDTPWTPGEFEIRILDVEQGDSQLIIFPSGFSVLIDVREASWNTGQGAAYIAQKIQAITGGTHVNVGVLSHLHLDHIGYAGYGGFWGLLETHGITFDKIVDRDAGVWVDGYGGGTVDGTCDPDLEIQWHNAGTQSGTARNWLCYATNPANTKIYPFRELAVLGSTTQIDPPDAGAVVEIVQVDGDGVMMVDGITPIQGDHTGATTPPSENDYSIGIKIRFGLIDYATAGDSDGEYATSQWGYTYNDVEAILAPRFGQVDILRANHHGSGHSTSQFYVDTLNPDSSAVSCGNNSYGHPAQSVIDRLLGTGDLYFTNVCDNTVNYGAAVIVNGDIIIRSTDGTNYTVDGVGYVASDPSGGTPTPTATPTNTPTPTPTPAASNMHAGDLDGSSTPGNRGRWNADVVITIEDDSHTPLANATVDGSWSNGANGSGSCVTDGTGQCTISKSNIKANSASVTFTITGVTHASSTYTPAANHDPDGDSDGTVIVVLQP